MSVVNILATLHSARGMRMRPILAFLILLPFTVVAQQLPIVEFDFFIETVAEDVNSVVIDVIITDPSPDTIFAYVINEVSSNASIGHDFFMDSPYELMFPPMSTTPQQLTIYIEDDELIEGTEAIMLAIESVVGPAVTGTEGEHVVFIEDNDECEVIFSLADTMVCNDAAPMALVGSPNGGTFSGPGVIGNLFYPQLCEPGVHAITYMVDQTNCLDSVTFILTVEVCAGINSVDPLSFKLYPNPANDRLFLELSVSARTDHVLKISDQLGRNVLIQKLFINAGVSEVSVEALEAGIYNLSVSDLKNSFNRKLIIR